MSLSPQQRKAIRKVTETMQDYPLGIEFSELMQKANSSKTGLTKALALIGASQSTDGFWHLPPSKDAPAPEKGLDKALEKMGFVSTGEQPVMQDKAENMQDGDLNTQAPQVSYPDNEEATLINPSAEVVNPSVSNTDADLDISEWVAESSSEEDFELQPSPVHQKRFILIENCFLSLAQDGTGQEPALAEMTWIGEEGEELLYKDAEVLNKAVERHSNEVEFLGVTYRRLFINNAAQLFHGIFDDIQTAKNRMDELMAKKPSNHFELLEI